MTWVLILKVPRPSPWHFLSHGRNSLSLQAGNNLTRVSEEETEGSGVGGFASQGMNSHRNKSCWFTGDPRTGPDSGERGVITAGE